MGKEAMTTPPDDWQDDARAAMQDACDEVMKWNIFIQSIRIALQRDSYGDFIDALLWLVGEEVEP